MKLVTDIPIYTYLYIYRRGRKHNLKSPSVGEVKMWLISTFANRDSAVFTRTDVHTTDTTKHRKVNNKCITSKLTVQYGHKNNVQG